MNPTADGVSAPTEREGDRRLAIIGGASVAVSIAALLGRLAGLMPSGMTAVIVLVSLIALARRGVQRNPQLWRRSPCPAITVSP